MNFRDGLYERRLTTQIIRTQHALLIGHGVTAKELKAALSKIPDEAKITEEADGEITRPFGSNISGTAFIFEIDEERQLEEK